MNKFAPKAFWVPLIKLSEGIILLLANLVIFVETNQEFEPTHLGNRVRANALTKV